MNVDEIDLPHIEGGKYFHSKSGHYYDVIGVALSTETGEAMVVYVPLWDSKYKLFVRPYDMFTGSVIVDGVSVPRFKYIGS